MRITCFDWRTRNCSDAPSVDRSIPRLAAPASHAVEATTSSVDSPVASVVGRASASVSAITSSTTSTTPWLSCSLPAARRSAPGSATRVSTSEGWLRLTVSRSLVTLLYLSLGDISLISDGGLPWDCPRAGVDSGTLSLGSERGCTDALGLGFPRMPRDIALVLVEMG